MESIDGNMLNVKILFLTCKTKGRLLKFCLNNRLYLKPSFNENITTTYSILDRNT